MLLPTQELSPPTCGYFATWRSLQPKRLEGGVCSWDRPPSTAVGPLPSEALLGQTSRVTGMHIAAHLHFFQHFEEFCRLERKEGNLLFDKSRHKARQPKQQHSRDTGSPPQALVLLPECDQAAVTPGAPIQPSLELSILAAGALARSP